ncbi:hypothetical protein QN277_017019 [Acacia crassicarpa]|uniref:Secreted protein n=1 Tax=Acacia crassicarpa TaxID=499986 RepID=A0AAE1JT63_9FABA|nr:hypothetical protein QN277_017019 [Acacia crassicarpa]
MGVGVGVLAFVLLLVIDDAAEATQVLTLRNHAGKRSGGGWHDDDEWRRSVGIVCKCCDGATCTPASASASASACSNLRCLPWKFH